MKKLFFIASTFSLLLLSRVSTVAMDLPPTDKDKTLLSQKKLILSLPHAFKAFENGDNELATEIFTALYCKTGAITPIRYLQHMGKNPLLPGEVVPEKGLQLSQAFLTPSLAFLDYKKNPSQKTFNGLALYVLNGNAHAITLMQQLFNEGAKHSTFFKGNKNFKHMRSSKELFHKFRHVIWGTIPYPDCLDVENLLEMYKSYTNADFFNALKIFETNYKRAPHLIGEIASKIAELYPNQSFWTYLAVENGVEKNLCRLADIWSNGLLIENEHAETKYEFSSY